MTKRGNFWDPATIFLPPAPSFGIRISNVRARARASPDPPANRFAGGGIFRKNRGRDAGEKRRAISDETIAEKATKIRDKNAVNPDIT